MEQKEGLEDKSERGGGEMIVTMEEKEEEVEVEEKSEIGGDIIEEKGDDDQYWLQLETPEERKYEINIALEGETSQVITSLTIMTFITR